MTAIGEIRLLSETKATPARAGRLGGSYESSPSPRTRGTAAGPLAAAGAARSAAAPRGGANLGCLEIGAMRSYRGSRRLTSRSTVSRPALEHGSVGSTPGYDSGLPLAPVRGDVAERKRARRRAGRGGGADSPLWLALSGSRENYFLLSWYAATGSRRLPRSTRTTAQPYRAASGRRTY